MAQTLLSGKSMKRKYFVSESWSQASVITKNEKLGIMLDPTPIHKNRDYRDFGDMFFDLKNDPLEIDNKINDIEYKNDIAKLRGYYNEFVKNIPATGKEEIISKYKKNK